MTWTIALDAATATHNSGLVVKFTPAPGERGAFDGRPVGAMPASIAQDPAAAARLMREAGDAYIAARATNHDIKETAMTKICFVIEQGTYNRSNWEPVPEGEFDSLEDARKAMADVETSLGWRDLRISREMIENNTVISREVIEYGIESETPDEE